MSNLQEITVDLANNEIAPNVNLYSKSTEVMLGKIEGHIKSVETGGAISGVNVTIPGTKYSTTTDEKEISHCSYQLDLMTSIFHRRNT